MLQQLPNDVVKSGQSPLFTAENVPDAILNWHTTKDNVWGEIVLIKGKATYEILTDPVEQIELTPEIAGIIAPAQPHRLRPESGTEFQIIFYKKAEDLKARDVR